MGKNFAYSFCITYIRESLTYLLEAAVLQGGSVLVWFFFLYKLAALSLVSHIDFVQVNLWGNTTEWSRCFTFCQKAGKKKKKEVWSKKVDLHFTLSAVWAFLFFE